MFKLYTNVAGWKKIDMSVDERDIVDTMVKGYDKYKLYDYMVIQRENDTDMIYKRTRTEEEFKEYVQEYKSRVQPLEDMSCVDLKKYIINKKGLE